MGRPLVVYHGTGRDFSQFKEGTRQSQYGGGFYFGKSPETASGFANPLRGPRPNVMPVFLSLQNPFVEVEGGPKMPKVPELKAQGYDGIIALDGQIVAFEPTQIKSVFNRGTFNPSDPNILHQSQVTPQIQSDVRDLAALASDITRENRLFGRDTTSEGERQILDDVSALLSWHGVKGDLPTQLATWHNLGLKKSVRTMSARQNRSSATCLKATPPASPLSK